MLGALQLSTRVRFNNLGFCNLLIMPWRMHLPFGLVPRLLTGVMVSRLGDVALMLNDLP